MKKTVLTYGFIGGGILALLVALATPFHDQIGFDRGVYVGYASMVAAFLMVYFGVVSYRDNVAGGTVTFGRAVSVGALISMLIMICYVAIWTFIFYQFLPDYFDKYSAYTLDQMRAAGQSASEIAAQGEQLKDFATLFENPLVFIAFGFLEPLPVALIFTLLTAWITSRKRLSLQRD